MSCRLPAYRQCARGSPLRVNSSLFRRGRCRVSRQQHILSRSLSPGGGPPRASGWRRCSLRSSCTPWHLQGELLRIRSICHSREGIPPRPRPESFLPHSQNLAGGSWYRAPAGTSENGRSASSPRGGSSPGRRSSRGQRCFSRGS